MTFIRAIGLLPGLFEFADLTDLLVDLGDLLLQETIAITLVVDLALNEAKTPIRHAQHGDQQGPQGQQAEIALPLLAQLFAPRQ